MWDKLLQLLPEGSTVVECARVLSWRTQYVIDTLILSDASDLRHRILTAHPQLTVCEPWRPDLARQTWQIVVTVG